MNYVDLLLRWTHIFSAIALVGGVFFWRWNLLPSLPTLSDASRDDLLDAIRTRWSRWVMAASGLLLVSGLINALRIIQRYQFNGGLYHMMVTVKLLLALAAFWLASCLAGRSSLAQRMRQRTRFWLNLNVTLVILLVGLAGVMRMTPRTPKPPSAAAAAGGGTTATVDDGRRFAGN